MCSSGIMVFMILAMINCMVTVGWCFVGLAAVIDASSDENEESCAASLRGAGMFLWIQVPITICCACCCRAGNMATVAYKKRRQVAGPRDQASGEQVAEVEL